jgi:hypothetical protein
MVRLDDGRQETPDGPGVFTLEFSVTGSLGILGRGTQWMKVEIAKSHSTSANSPRAGAYERKFTGKFGSSPTLSYYFHGRVVFGNICCYYSCIKHLRASAIYLEGVRNIHSGIIIKRIERNQTLHNM